MGNRIEVEDLELDYFHDQYRNVVPFVPLREGGAHSGPEEVAKAGGSGDLAGKALTVEC